MVVTYVKKFRTVNGKRYGPYPKDPNTYYLYEVTRENRKIKQKFLGKGPKPKETDDPKGSAEGMMFMNAKFIS